jgi:hypothetical protein
MPTSKFIALYIETPHFAFIESCSQHHVCYDNAAKYKMLAVTHNQYTLVASIGKQA